MRKMSTSKLGQKQKQTNPQRAPPEPVRVRVTFVIFSKVDRCRWESGILRQVGAFLCTQNWHLRFSRCFHVRRETSGGGPLRKAKGSRPAVASICIAGDSKRKRGFWHFPGDNEDGIKVLKTTSRPAARDAFAFSDCCSWPSDQTSVADLMGRWRLYSSRRSRVYTDACGSPWGADAAKRR